MNSMSKSFFACLAMLCLNAAWAQAGDRAAGTNPGAKDNPPGKSLAADKSAATPSTTGEEKPATVSDSARPGGTGSEKFWQMIDDGKYKEVLPLLNKALAAKGDAAKAFDRYELLVIKGEAALHLRNASMAADAFHEASKSTDKPDDAGLARGTELLIRASSDLKYVPKTGERAGSATTKLTPLDIVTPATRKEASMALFADLLSKDKPRIAAAVNATTLPQLIAAINSLSDLRPVEIAATGKDEQSRPLLEDVAGRAQKLLAEAAQSVDDRQRNLSDQANEYTRYSLTVDSGGGALVDVPARWVRGLTPQIRSGLQQVINDANQIAGVAAEMRQAAGDAADFVAVRQSALKVAADANRTLTTDYNKMNKNRP